VPTLSLPCSLRLRSTFVVTVDWGKGGDNLDDGNVDLLGVQVVVEYPGTCVQLIDLTTTIILISNLTSEHLIFSLVHLWYCWWGKCPDHGCMQTGTPLLVIYETLRMVSSVN